MEMILALWCLTDISVYLDEFLCRFLPAEPLDILSTLGDVLPTTGRIGQYAQALGDKILNVFRIKHHIPVPYHLWQG